MRFSCFRPSTGKDLSDDTHDAPRRVSTISVKRGLRRQGTSQSTTSSRSSSNSSIASLPPCRTVDDARVEAMMMPVPHDNRPSRCMRLSQPKTYTYLVNSMKEERGCRDWRSFDVFGDDGEDVDDRIDANEVARRRAADCARKCELYNKVPEMEFVP